VQEIQFRNELNEIRLNIKLLWQKQLTRKSNSAIFNAVWIGCGSFLVASLAYKSLPGLGLLVLLVHVERRKERKKVDPAQAGKTGTVLLSGTSHELENHQMSAQNPPGPVCFWVTSIKEQCSLYVQVVVC
jgi:hypothetical protein